MMTSDCSVTDFKPKHEDAEINQRLRCQQLWANYNQSGFSQTRRNRQYWHHRLYYLKTKQSRGKMLPPVGIELGPFMNLWFQVQHFLFWAKWHLLLRESLNFCLCNTWFLALDHLVGINRAWLYKTPKVSILQANTQLVQKGECWTWNQRFMRVPGSIPTGG